MGAALESGDGVFHGAIGGDEQDESFGTDLEKAVKQRDAVHAGKLHVADGDSECCFARAPQRFLRRAARRHREAFLRKEFGEAVANYWLVIDDQDRRSRAGHNVQGSGGKSKPQDESAAAKRFLGVNR